MKSEIILIVIIFSLSLPLLAQAAEAVWYDTSWLLRKNITINASSVNGSQTNFPVLINITDTDLQTDAQSNGNDILFTANDEITKLNHEIELFDSATGNLIVWVEMNVSSTDTRINITMYYNNSAAADQRNAAGVWDANYMGVWHLNQSSTGTKNEFRDSTANANHGTGGGGNVSKAPILNSSGQIDGANTFDRVDDYINISQSANLNATAEITVEAWVNVKSVASSWNYIGFQSTPYEFGFFSSLVPRFKIKNTTGTTTEAASAKTIPADSWNHVVGVYNGSHALLYVNGTLVKVSARTSGNVIKGGVTTLGGTATSSRLNGTIDEYRVSNTSRSITWITTAYMNQKNTSTFYAIGSEETVPVTGTTTTQDITQAISFSSSTAGEGNLNRRSIQAMSTTTPETSTTQFLKTIAQPTTATTNTGSAQGILKTTTQIFSTTDSINRIRTIPIALTQAFATTDITGRLMDVLRTFTTQLNINAPVGKISTFLQTTTQQILTSLGTSTPLIKVREMINVIGLSDTIQRTFFSLRQMTNALSLNNATIRMVSLTKTITNSLTVNNVITRIHSITISVTDAFTTTANTNILFTRVRLVAQAFSINESVGKTQTFVRNLTNAMDLTEAFNRLASFTRSLTNAMDLTEVVEVIRKVPREVANALDLTESATRAQTLLRTVTGSLNISNAMSRIVSFLRNVTGSFALIEKVTTSISGKIFITNLEDHIVRVSLSPTVTTGYLEVTLVTPNPSATTNVNQNQTFTINATVYCRGGSCGNVNGTARYNASSSNPDTAINTTSGDKPFYVNETPALAMKACPTNPLDQNEFCNITWTINATGNVNTGWKIGTLFNSSSGSITDNHTNNATVSIVSCSVDMTTQFTSISFGTLDPNWYNISATGNDGNAYNITINSGSCNTDLYINSTDLTNSSSPYFSTPIRVGNLTFNNATNSNASAFYLGYSTQAIKLNAVPGTNVTTWYYLSVPPVYAGVYNGTITIFGVKQNDPAP